MTVASMQSPRWVTVGELAELTGLTQEAIWAYKKRASFGRRYPIKKGRRLFIHIENFYTWLENTEE